MQTTTAKETGAHKRNLKNHLDDDGRRLKKGLHEAANHAHSDLSDAAHAVGQHVREFVENASDGVMHTKASITDATDHVAKQIRRNPVPASAIALGIGMLIGAIFLRRTA